MKKVHFVSGLPRSCSTLLCNILAQNPSVHSTGTSPLHELGYVARNVFKTEESKSMNPQDFETLYLDYVKGGILNAYNSLTDRSIVIDKSRSWLGHLDQLFRIFPNAKVLVPVRDVRGIIASMEKKFRKHPSSINPSESQNPYNWTTVEKRAQSWLNSMPIGIAIERLYEAVSRFREKIFIIHAEQLTINPEKTMKSVWEYLEEKPYNHNFLNVEQYTTEYDLSWPYGDHIIRNKVEPIYNDYDEVLGKELSNAIIEKFQWIKNL